MAIREMVIGWSRPQLRAEYLGARGKQVGSTFPLVRFTCLSGVRRMQLWRMRLSCVQKAVYQGLERGDVLGASSVCSLRRHTAAVHDPALIPFARDWRSEMIDRTATVLPEALASTCTQQFRADVRLKTCRPRKHWFWVPHLHLPVPDRKGVSGLFDLQTLCTGLPPHWNFLCSRQSSIPHG